MPTALIVNRSRESGDRRNIIIPSCERLAAFRWKAILIEATYEDLKSYYRDFGDDLQTEAHPNAVCGTYDAIEAKFGIPVLYTSRRRILATEKAASWLSKNFTYWWLEQNGHDRTLIDSDGLYAGRLHAKYRHFEIVLEIELLGFFWY